MLKSSQLLRVLSGIVLDPLNRIPGSATLYDFLNRLHDGLGRQPCPHSERPSDLERRRSRSPQHRAKKERRRGKRKSKRTQKRQRKKERQKQLSASERVINALKQIQNQKNPTDLLERLGLILLDVCIKPSVERGFLSQTLQTSGDGSALPTGANRHGAKTCEHDKRSPCNCPRIYSDPDANIGYDSHRDLYFFGYHLYEIVAHGKGGHDLPLHLRLDPASTSDFVAFPRAMERTRKMLRDHSELSIDATSLDAGHDGLAIYQYLQQHDIAAVIALKQKAPATHPGRKDLSLSRRGVPLCPAGQEMMLHARSGQTAQVFRCPFKAGNIERCPLAPDDEPTYCCEPLKRYGKTVKVNTRNYERLFPTIPRNHSLHKKLMRKRSSSERSFSVKKGPFKLIEARHRRKSFWLIRCYLIAMLQHAMAWVSKRDTRQFIAMLTGHKQEQSAA